MPDLTPQRLVVVERDDDEESIDVLWHDGTRVRVQNVARDDEARDRYRVLVFCHPDKHPKGCHYSSEMRAPEHPGRDWASDPMRAAAEAACSFACADGWLSC